MKPSQAAPSLAVRRPPVRAFSAALRLTLIVVAFVFFVQRFWFVTDDAFISLRYSRNWAEGRGIVFNPGEAPPVEGYSNFLWVAIGALVHRLGLDLTVAMPLLSAACGAGVLVLLHRIMRHTLEIGPWPAAVALLIVACCPIFSVWCTGGLETMPFVLLLLIVFDLLILRPDRPAPVAAGIAAVLMSLIRVEGLCWALFLAGLAFVSRRLARQSSARLLSLYLAIVLAAFSCYVAWRTHYYGELVSNTAYAKYGSGGAYLVRGIQYVGAQFLMCAALWLVVPGAFAALRAGRIALGLPVLVMALAVPAYAALVSGDFMPYGRFIVPMLPFVAILTAWLICDLARGGIGRRCAASLVACGTIAAAALPALDVHLTPASLRQTCDFRRRAAFYSEYVQWRLHQRQTVDWTQIGCALPHVSRPGDSLVEIAIGAIGYYSDLIIYDRCGLVTPEVARRPLDAALHQQPGHDRSVPPGWFLERGHTPTFLRVDRLPVVPAQTIAPMLSDIVDRTRERLGRDLQYLPAFYRIRTGGHCVQQILICWRRASAGTDLSVAWREVYARIAAAGDPNTIPALEIETPAWARQRMPLETDAGTSEPGAAKYLP